MGTAGLAFLGVAASAPMAVLVGGVVATFAVTGVIGTPLSFLVIAVPLLLISVGTATISHDVPHTAAFYAFLARGLGRFAGLAGAAVALVSYNAIQISLYGLFGASAADLFGGTWWSWALAAWAVVAVLGMRRIGVNTRLIAVVALLQIGFLTLFAGAALSHPANLADTLEPLRPDALLVPGVGGVFALSVAAFIGFESIVVYREEAREHRSLGRALFATISFLGMFYAVVSWALAVAVGPAAIVDTARDPSADLPYAVLTAHYGPTLAAVGRGVLLLSVSAAMLAFHHVVARYVFGLSREGVLPKRWSTTGGSLGGVPLGGSLAQSVVALITVATFAVTGADPITSLFTLLSTLAALGIMVILIGSSMAVIRFYARAAYRPNPARWLVAPSLGGTGLAVVLLVAVSNLAAVTGDAGGPAQWALPAAIAAAAAAGVAWAVVLRTRHPVVYNTIGRGEPPPLSIPDRALSHLEL